MKVQRTKTLTQPELKSIHSVLKLLLQQRRSMSRCSKFAKFKNLCGNKTNSKLC